MKNIIALLLIGVAIVALINASSDMAKYSTFSDAKDKSEKVKVTAQLMKEKPMVYDPQKDPNYFSFYAVDPKGNSSKVILLAKKPQDFERSENLVMTGQFKEDTFYASDILLKCPSKYKDEEIYIKSVEKP